MPGYLLPKQGMADPVAGLVVKALAGVPYDVQAALAVTAFIFLLLW